MLRIIALAVGSMAALYVLMGVCCAEVSPADLVKFL